MKHSMSSLRWSCRHILVGVHQCAPRSRLGAAGAFVAYETDHQPRPFVQHSKGGHALLIIAIKMKLGGLIANDTNNRQLVPEEVYFHLLRFKRKAPEGTFLLSYTYVYR
jgi:hypothetical protein